MEPVHIFYSELETDGNNIFTANTSQENEVENVLFKKNKEYAISGMKIKPGIVDSDSVKVIKQKNILNKRIQELVDRKKRTRFRSKNS